MYPSIASVDGHPAIAYAYSEDGDLRYVRADDADGDSWPTAETILSGGEVSRISLTEINGQPAMAYSSYDGENLDLCYGVYY